jgi:hypothetical protein
MLPVDKSKRFSAVGQVAPFGTADKSSYQPWLFVMLGAKNRTHHAKNLPSLRFT